MKTPLPSIASIFPTQLSPVPAYNTEGLAADCAKLDTAIFSKSCDNEVHEVPELDVFQTPPPTPAAYHVFPVLSAASTTIALVLPGTFAGPLSVNVAVAAAEVPKLGVLLSF